MAKDKQTLHIINQLDNKRNQKMMRDAEIAYIESAFREIENSSIANSVERFAETNTNLYQQIQKLAEKHQIEPSSVIQKMCARFHANALASSLDTASNDMIYWSATKA